MTDKRLRWGGIAIVFVSIWVAANIFGHMSVAGLPKLYSGSCVPILGCNDGFYGFDSYIHFGSGVGEVFIILWAVSHIRKWDFFSDNVWKNAAIMLSLAAVCAVSWELFEFASDQFRTYVLHKDLFSAHRFAQPSRADTVGDMFFAIMGASVAFAGIAYRFAKKRERRALVAETENVRVRVK
jgi:hypothetical protein